LSCHDKVVKVACKKQGASASADRPNDTVPVDETVRVPQDLINGKKFKSIELGLITNLSWRWRRHLIKPSELADRLLFFILAGIYCFSFCYFITKCLISQSVGFNSSSAAVV